MSKTMKKILTVDDLIKFCQEQKFAKFSSKETGYQLAVKVPTTFEVENNVDDNHRGMMKLKFRIFHTGLNRNNSFVSKESATKAMNTIADRPVLAAIHQLDSGEWDFEGHEMEVVTDENGNEELRYIESQVGSFSSEPAFWETENGKDYVCAYAYISREYTKACEIIERKQGTKNSCELFIDELAYNAKEKYLELIDFYVNASTLLGARSDGTQIQEGMEGSRADIADFSVENNSIKFNKDEKLIELLETLNSTLSNFNKYYSKEGGNETNMFEKLLEKYGKTVEDITFDYAELSDEELEAKFAEMFEEAKTGTDGSGDEPSTDGEGDGTADDPEPTSEGDDNDISDEGNSDDNTDEDNSDEDAEPIVESNSVKVKPEKYSISMSDGSIKEFELTLDDITYAIFDLVNTVYGEADNTYYYVSVYENNYVVMHDYWTGRAYKQAYSREGDSFTLTGDRVEVFANWLTKEEENSLAELRSNYSVIEEQLKKYQVAEENSKKDALFVSEDYSSIADKEEFKALAEDHIEFSVDELKSKLDAIILDYAKKGGLNFSAEPEKKSGRVALPIQTKANKKSRYGSLKFN